MVREAMVNISLGDAHYKDDSEIIPKKLNHKYIQRSGVKGAVRGFILFDDIYLYYSLKYFKLKKLGSRDIPRHRIDLTYLDPEPKKILHLAWKWLLAGMIAVFGAALVIYVGEYSDFSYAHRYMLPVGILLAASGFVSILLFFFKSYNNVIYMSYAGRVPLMELSHKPRNKDYNDFIAVVESGIQLAQSRNGITVKDILVGEMKDIRRLKDIGIISEKVYEKAQSKIFKHELYSA